MAPNPRPVALLGAPASPVSPPPADFPITALGPMLAAAVTDVAALTQAPPALVAHHTLTLAAAAAQRLIDVRLPTGARRPVSCLFASLVGTGEGRGAVEKLVVDVARVSARDLFSDPRPARPEDRYRAHVRQSALFARHPFDLVQSGPQRRAEAATLCALWDGKVFTRAAAAPLYPRLAAHVVATPRAGRALLRDADLEDAGLLGRLLVAAPAPLVGARIFRAAENDDPPHALQALLMRLNDLNAQPAVAPPRAVGFSADAAARWLAYAHEVEAAMAPGGTLAPLRSFAVHLPEHAARLAAVLAFVNEDDLTDITLAHLESGLALARFYTDERLRLIDQAAPALDEPAQEDLLREWLARRDVEKVFTLRDLCRTGPKPIRDVDTLYKLMRRMERAGVVQVANEVGQSIATPRRMRTTYAWRVEGEKGHVA